MHPDSQSTPGRRARAIRAAAVGLAFLGSLSWLVHAAIEWVVVDAAKNEVVIARLVAHQLDQTIRAGKIVLTGAALQMRQAESFEAGSARAITDLSPLLAIEPKFLALKFVDADGRLVGSSNGQEPGFLGPEMPEYFEGIARDRDFHIGYDRRHDGEAELVLAHGLRDGNGRFVGVVALAIHRARLHEGLDTSVALADRKIVAMRPDGIALFRAPEEIEAAGRNMAELPFARAMLGGSRFGTYDAVSPFDGARRVGGYAWSPDREIIVLSARGRAGILRAAILGKGQVTLIAAMFLALASAGAVYAANELRRRRRLLDEREELLRSLDVASAGIAISGAGDQSLHFVNSAFERMTGFSSEEILGKNCRILQGPGTDPATVARIREKLRNGEPVRVDVLNYHKNGTPYWSDLSIAPIRASDGTIKGFVSAFLDVTARIDMTDRLSGALARAHAADRAKSTFLARMSHELRTPLNAIIGFSEVMRLRLMGPLPDRYADYAGDILGSGRHLLELVERILEMSRLEADTRSFERTAIDLADVARTAATLARTAIDGAAMRLDLDIAERPTAVGDATALRQIVVNLLVNAARHGRIGGAIRVRAYVSKDGRARLEVLDDGPGIAPELLAKLGTPFLGRRADTADGSGMGLGLAISMELAKRMGGNLEIANANPGVRATLDMPSFADAGDKAA